MNTVAATAAHPQRDAMARSRQPLYLQLAAEFRSLVESGTWDVGAQIPPLDSLMAHYRVSRMTVRNALGELEAEGLVRRGRGKGTFVERRGPAVTELELPTTWEEAVALSDLLGTHSFPTTQTTVTTLPEIGMACRSMPAADYHFLRRVHHKDGVPYCYSEVYVAASLYDQDPAAFESRAAASVIARMPGLVVDESRQKLTIIQAGLHSASALRLEVGQPVAEVRRHACAGGLLIYYARLEFPFRFVKLELDLLARDRREHYARG